MVKEILRKGPLECDLFRADDVFLNVVEQSVGRAFHRIWLGRFTSTCAALPQCGLEFNLSENLPSVRSDWAAHAFGSARNLPTMPVGKK